MRDQPCHRVWVWAAENTRKEVALTFMLSTGEILKRERKRLNLTLDEIEKKTRIRKKNLDAIERGDWKSLPSKTYILGTVKLYGKFLNLNDDKLAAFFRREYAKKEDIKFKKRVGKHYLVSPGKKIFKLIIGAIFALLIVYFGYQLKIYFSPPPLKILSPQKTIFRREEKIELIGKTEREAIVNVNGERVYLDKDNIFKIAIPLPKAKNQVTIEVTGANGRKTIVKKVFEKSK